jgi:GT2 family glycosyltransferase
VTADRREVAGLALARLDGQTRRPDLVVVSAPEARHVDPLTRTTYPLTFAFGARGCTAQRNRALDLVAAQKAEIVVFLDDDFVPAQDYLQRVEQAFARHPDWSVLTGHVVADGVKGPGIGFAAAAALLDGACLADRSGHDAITRAGAYGCNMAYRAAAIGALRFDERLPLYGWQEDTDFSRRVARGQPVIRLHALRGVHLGVKGGRVSGVRFGYSQIVNPVYLVRKGTASTRWATALIVRNMLANAALCLRPEAHVDRPGRLRGNLIAVGHLLRGRIEPEYIVQL